MKPGFCKWYMNLMSLSRFILEKYIQTKQGFQINWSQYRVWRSIVAWENCSNALFLGLKMEYIFKIN